MTISEFLKEWKNAEPTVLVHTSGSTGKPKPMLAEKRRMEASARTTCRFLGLNEGDTALLCLPLDYIAGKMMVVRALTCGLKLVSVEPDGHPLASLITHHPTPITHHPTPITHHPTPITHHPTPITLAAMVPLQVWNSLQVTAEREQLRQIRHLIIGGGAIDQRLAEALSDFPYAVWSTYGMTETLSHIALRRLNGPERSDWYEPFEGVDVELSADGCLVIRAPEVCPDVLVTNDLAEIEGRRFRILGRKDNVVCSGGVKIQLEEVEARLRGHTNAPLMATKVPDERLGEALVLLTIEGHADQLRRLCAQVLPRYWRPRSIFTVSHLPLTPTGKPARQAAQQMAQEMMG